MYMGVILHGYGKQNEQESAPHVYGGDPGAFTTGTAGAVVLPMYMGVIRWGLFATSDMTRAPHVYGGDP